MHNSLKMAAALAFASGLIASQAFAGETLSQRRLAERNTDYFSESGSRSSSNWAPQAVAYDVNNPHHRMGQRSFEYFAGKAAPNSKSH